MTDYRPVQQRLNELGASPPLTVDGAYGPLSRAAVIAFQQSRGLTPDGIVGPQTLAALGLGADGAAPAPASSGPGLLSKLFKGGTSAPAANLDPNNIHVKAKAATDSLGLTHNESMFLRAVAWHETNYGQGWGSTPPPEGGAGSFNMGAVTTANPGPLDFKHVDSRNDTGQVIQYTTWFKGYPSFQAGMAGLANVLLKPNVKAALAKNDFPGAVAAMYDNHYFLGVHPRNTPEGNAANVKDYVNAVEKAVATYTPFTLEQIGAGAAIGLGGAAVLGGLGWLAWKFFTKGA